MICLVLIVFSLFFHVSLLRKTIRKKEQLTYYFSDLVFLHVDWLSLLLPPLYFWMIFVDGFMRLDLIGLFATSVLLGKASGRCVRGFDLFSEHLSVRCERKG